ncbi:hypothetical protein JCM8097_000840 [Rhodosporidiobolus ruineniae]
MSLSNRSQPTRPMNPPPADAFTSYRPQQDSNQPRQPPQRNNSAGQGSGAQHYNQQDRQGGGQGGQGQGQQPSSGGGGASSNKPPPLTLEQSKTVARTHYSALKGWLTKEGALAAGSTRTNAREKLTRLTRQQFQELSTDVYDELMRRIDDASGRPGEQPFLAVRPDFHPKRNQARQKLATLPILRFRDLASDVYYELDRRYPEFAEEDANSPSSGAGTPQAISRSGSLASQHNSGMTSPHPPSNLNARRAPTPQQHQQQHHSPQPSNSYSHSHGSSPSGGGQSQHSSDRPAGVPAGNDVVVPNKSTMMVEDDSPAVGGGSSSFPAFGSGSNPTSPLSERIPSPRGEEMSAEDRRGSVERALSPVSLSGAGNYGAGGRSLLASPPLRAPSPRGDEAEELADKPAQGSKGLNSGALAAVGGHQQSRASETSSIGTRFFGGYAGSAAASEAGGRRSLDWDAQQAVEKVKSEYEYKLTMLQNRVAELERENDDAASALRGQRSEQDRARDLERELRDVRERFDNQSDQLTNLQREHDVLRSTSSRSAQSPSFGSASSSQADQHLRTKLHEAEELANELRGEVSSLVDELREVNERCEVLQGEVDQEREGKEKAEREAGEWKSRWQAAKVELRNIKATSQLFSSSISVDADYMPASSDGLIKDTSIAAFQTSIDDLLQAARSKEPSSVLPAARAVVSACEMVDNDVQAISPSRLASLPPSDQDLVNSLKVKINATLSNLMTASKNHAMSFGVSPVSLLDAAASHLAATIVELVRILKIRRSAGGGGGGRSSLDPSAAFGLGAGRGGFNHEPMPPLPEYSQPSSSSQPPPPAIEVPRRDTSPDVGPAPPAKERERQQEKEQQSQQPKERTSYLSGGMSSLLGGGAGSVSKALEAMGISSGKRSSVDSQDGGEREKQAPASSSQPQPPQQQQQPPERESLAFSDMSLDSSARASPIPPVGAGSNDYHRQQQQPQQRGGYEQYQQQQHDAYPQYGQQQPGLNRDTSQSSLAYAASNSPPSSYSQQQPFAGAPPLDGGRNGQPAYEYGAEYQAQDGGNGYGEERLQDAYDGANGADAYNPYGSPELRRSERDPEELRAYIENQTENIVHAIQQLLSAIRSGAQDSELSDWLTEIITIVSSIVAISHEALPSSARQEGDAVLADLTRHCDQLSEMQNGPSHGGERFNKGTKQAMAAGSFGVAKSLKQLNSLLQGQQEEGLV